jgi:hypothetical protein
MLFRVSIRCHNATRPTNMKFYSLSRLRLPASFASLVLLGAVGAHAGPSPVAVSFGYNDEPRNGVSYSVGSGQPDPWYGSVNTTYYGNAGVAQAYDPDINAILLNNLGGATLFLTAANMGAYDLFSTNGISGPVALNPGANVILAGVDGSDFGGGTVGLTIGGFSYSYSDVATTDAPFGVLFGASPWIGNSESIPWTSIYTPTSSVADGGTTAAMLGSALLGLAALRRKFSR